MNYKIKFPEEVRYVVSRKSKIIVCLEYMVVCINRDIKKNYTIAKLDDAKVLWSVSFDEMIGNVIDLGDCIAVSYKENQTTVVSVLSDYGSEIFKTINTGYSLYGVDNGLNCGCKDVFTVLGYQDGNIQVHQNENINTTKAHWQYHLTPKNRNPSNSVVLSVVIVDDVILSSGGDGYIRLMDSKLNLLDSFKLESPAKLERFGVAVKVIPFTSKPYFLNIHTRQFYPAITEEKPQADITYDGRFFNGQ